MEVVLEDSEGVPAGAVLSMKLGDTKRQAPATRLGQPFRFTAPGSEALTSMKVELLLPAAPPQVVQLDATTERFVVDFGTMRVQLSKRQPGEHSLPAVKDNTPPGEKFAKAQQAATYLEEHDLVRIFQDILQGLLVDKPPDPWSYVSKRVQSVDNKSIDSSGASENAKVDVAKQVQSADKENIDSFGEDMTAAEEAAAAQRADDPAHAAGQRGSVLSRSKVDTLLGKLAETRNNLHLVLPFLPDDLSRMLMSDELASDCRRQFTELDSKKADKLEPNDLLPVIVQLSAASQQSIGTDQARRFLTLFDTNQDGFIYLDDFAALVQFVMITAYLESEEGKEVVEMAKLEDKHFFDFIKMIEEDRERLWDIIGFLPEWLVDHVTCGKFCAECIASFEELDKDKNGTLEPVELLPVVISLSETHPLTIDAKKCEAFVKVFDVHKNGVIMKDEFIEFVQFMTVMSFLSGTPEGQALKQKADLASGSKRSEHLLKMLADDPSKLVEALPYLPKALVEQVTGQSFARSAKRGFFELDKNRKGVLDHAELTPVVLALCDGNAFRDYVAQSCADSAAIFDKDKKGVISIGEFQHLACFIIVMGYLKYTKDHKDMALAEVMLGQDRIQELIKTLKSRTESLDDLLPHLPDAFKKELLSQTFADRCLQDFRLLDKDASGVLEPKELMPVILHLSQAHHYALTEEHAKVFVDIFDVERNGVITSNEFIDFARFMLIMAYLDTEEGHAVDEKAQIVASKNVIGDLLQSLERDWKAIHKVIPLLPPSVFELITSTQFVTRCHDYFVELDKSKTNTLSPPELFPVIVELSRAHPFAVDLEQCERFTRIFDVHGDGVVRMDEFLDLARFMCVMSFLHSSEGKERVEDALKIMSDSQKIEDLLSMLKADRHQVHKVFPFLPAELREELLSERFTLDCLASFNELDTDSNGSLDPSELFPVVKAMSQVHQLALDGSQCARFTEIFDDGCQGVITKGEFVNFARFLIVMSYLQTEEGQDALAVAHTNNEVGANRSIPPEDGAELAVVYEEKPQAPEPAEKEVPLPAGLSPTMMDPIPGSTSAGHLAVDAEFYESKAARLSHENGELRERIFGLESAMRRLEARLEEQDNRLRHADLDLKASETL